MLALDASILTSMQLMKEEGEFTHKSLRLLASFIGALTLVRNRVLPLRKLNLRALLRKSCEENYVQNALVFVTALLACARDSAIFHSVRQPWLHGLLLDLLQMHEDAALPANVKKAYVPVLLDQLGLSDEEKAALKDEAAASLLSPAFTEPSRCRSPAFASPPVTARALAALAACGQLPRAEATGATGVSPAAAGERGGPGGVPAAAAARAAEHAALPGEGAGAAAAAGRRTCRRCWRSCR